MSLILIIDGQSFTYPTEADEDWGEQASLWAQAVSTKLLQRSGGTFTLSNEVDFGASFGLKSLYYKSRGTNPATAGVARFANAEYINWRNFANNANLPLGVNASNELTFDGVPLLVAPGGVLAVADGGTGLASYTAGDLIYASATTTLAKLGIGTANYVLVSNGSVPGYALLVNANVDAAAAIARTKFANGTASYVLINDGSGVMSEEATLAKVRGGFAADMSSATFPTTGTFLSTTNTVAPTVQRFTSGSGTYTTPSSPRAPLYIRVRMVGGGGGGGGSGSTSGAAGSSGGTTTFGTSLLTATGGATGAWGATGGSGGSSTVNSPAVTTVAVSAGRGHVGSGNGNAGPSTVVQLGGGNGASTPLGGGGFGGAPGPAAGGNGETNSGAGGGGAGMGNAASCFSGSGGGGGGFIDAIITSPSSSYSYAVGSGGGGQAAGTSGAAGGAGAAGIIIVEEYYQ